MKLLEMDQSNHVSENEKVNENGKENTNERIEVWSMNMNDFYDVVIDDETYYKIRVGEVEDDDYDDHVPHNVWWSKE